MYAQNVLGTPLWRLGGPHRPWSAYEHEEVYTPLVSAPEGKNWRECNVDMIY
jgi:hypothetical protein